MEHKIITAVIDGSPRRVKASAKALKMGLVVKPTRRKYTYKRPQPEQA